MFDEQIFEGRIDKNLSVDENMDRASLVVDCVVEIVNNVESHRAGAFLHRKWRSRD